MTADAFRVTDLVVRYGTVTAVDHLSLSSPPGRITALLGPNGAGKSSLLQALSTLLRPTSGTVRVFGHDVCAQPLLVRRQIGLLFQERVLDMDLSVRQNLWFHARLFGLSASQARHRIDELLEFFGLSRRRDQVMSELSGGLSRRVEIARALLHKPGLLILDEPTTALDPEARRAVWDDLRRLKREVGATVLYSTHYLDEAELADEIVIVHDGQVVRRGSPSQMRTSLGASKLLLSTPDDETALRRLVAAGLDAVAESGGLAIRCAEPERQVGLVVQAVGVPVLTLSAHHPSMDDVYLAFTGQRQS
ncbi:MAG: ABC transporter ATP-binding protein [Pseudonocardiaceae bacterium]